MLTTYDVMGQWYSLGACKYCNIFFIDENAKKKKRNSLEYDKIQRIFK